MDGSEKTPAYLSSCRRARLSFLSKYPALGRCLVNRRRLMRKRGCCRRHNIWLWLRSMLRGWANRQDKVIQCNNVPCVVSPFWDGTFRVWALSEGGSSISVGRVGRMGSRAIKRWEKVLLSHKGHLYCTLSSSRLRNHHVKGGGKTVRARGWGNQIATDLWSWLLNSQQLWLPV